MHSKKDTLPLLPLRTANEPSLLSSLPSGESGEEAQPSSEILSQNAQEHVISEDEIETWDDEIEPLKAEEDDTELELWHDEIDSMDTQEEELESWDDEIDPFEYRHLPTSVEAAPIEEADIRHAFSQAYTHIIDNTPMLPTARTRSPQRSILRWQALPRRHRFVVIVGLLIVILLIGDGALFLLNMTRPHSSPAS